MSQLIRRAIWLGAILALLGGVGWGWRMGLSVLVGGLVAWLNFHWMQQGVDRVLGAGPRHKSEGKILLQYVLRLLLILATLFAIIHFSFLSLAGGVVGLSIFVLSGMCEAVLLLYRQLRRSL